MVSVRLTSVPLVLVALAFLTLFQAHQILSTRSFNDGFYETAALHRLRSRPGTSLGLFSEGHHPVNRTVTTKLRRVRSAKSSQRKPKEGFLHGLKSSAARASHLSLRGRRGYSTLDARSGVFVQETGHAMEVQFGSPPHPTVLLLLVDLASSLTWTQCVPCSSCIPQSAPLFDPTTSTSYLGVPCADNMCNYLQHVDPITSGSCANTCQYKVTYGDGSFSNGEFAQETMTLAGGGNSVPNVFMGCGHNNYGFDGYNGIIGLDSSSLSFASQLGKFSFCFLPESYAHDITKSTPIVFGDPSFPGDAPSPGSVATGPNPVTHVPYYYVNVAYISVNGEFINVPGDAFKVSGNGGGGVIMDSGTTYSVLRDVVYDALVAQMMVTNPTNIKSGDSPCWPLAPGGLQSMQNLPFIVFNMFTGDMGISLEGTYQVLGSNVCLAMARSTDSTAPTVIGNFQMTNQFMLFNPEAGQIQFALYDCMKLVSPL